MKIKNINLGYILIASNNAFFWYAPWLLFLYKFINIEQATILQLVGMVTRVVSEIPTGAFADLLGKKRVLIIAFFLTAIGETAMAFSTQFAQFVIVYIIINLGYSFYSGTLDAFMYDTLLENKREEDYPKVLSRSSAILNISTAIATITGGFLFSIWIGLPFLMTGIVKFIGVFISLFIKEPVVDSFKFSLKNFIFQTANGLKVLFSNKMIKYTLLMLIIGGFSTVAYEILDDAAVVNWGYSAQGISYLYTAVIILSIPSSFLYNHVAKRINPQKIIYIAIIILALNYLFSPLINVFVWTGIYLLRVVFSPLKQSAITDVINQNTPSSVRATTLSSYELLTKLPFALLGAPIGIVLKQSGINYFGVIYAGLLLIVFIIYIFGSRRLKTDPC